MKLRGALALTVVILALGGCAQRPIAQGQAPYAPYSDNNRNMRDSGGDGSGGGDM